MTRTIAAGLAALVVAASAGMASAQSMIDETRDRVLIIHQSRGTLAPGTRPKCFPPSVDETTARAFYQCPAEAPNGRRPYPTARSFWGLTGND